jgi:hypothetical protein
VNREPFIRRKNPARAGVRLTVGNAAAKLISMISRQSYYGYRYYYYAPRFTGRGRWRSRS